MNVFSKLLRRKQPLPLAAAAPASLAKPLAELAAERAWPVREILPTGRQFRQPSRTIPENFAKAAANYDEWIASHDVTRTSGEKRWAKQYLDELYSVSMKPFSPAFEARLSDVEIETGHGCVRTVDGVVVSDSTLVNARLAARAFQEPREKLRSGFLLFGSWPQNYAHWLMDSLPRLAAIDFDPGTDPVLLPHAAKAFHSGSLDVLGISGCEEIPAPCVSVDELRFVRAATRTGYPRAEFLESLRLRFRERLPVMTKPKRIYVSRALATRRVVNEEEIFASFAAAGFERVHCEELTFREQWELFGQAEIVAGPHGAGIYNLLFACPGAKVIEIFHPHRWDSAAARISSLLDFDHWHLFGEPAGGTFDMKVDRASADRLLEFALR